MTPVTFDLQKAFKSERFRVSIFGSARVQPDDPLYKEAYALADAIAKMGVDLVTGGGPGLMEAASCGHKDGDHKKESYSIGLNIHLPFEQKDNPGLEFINTHERFSTRLDEFMLLSNAVIVLPGGIGTCLEFFYTWQLIQVNQICKMPIILLGEMWKTLINWVIDEPLKLKYLDAKDLDTLVIVDNAQQAIEVLKAAKIHYEKDPEACVNWRKYGSHLQGKVT